MSEAWFLGHSNRVQSRVKANIRQGRPDIGQQPEGGTRVGLEAGLGHMYGVGQAGPTELWKVFSVILLLHIPSHSPGG